MWRLEQFLKRATKSFCEHFMIVRPECELYAFAFGPMKPAPQERTSTVATTANQINQN